MRYKFVISAGAILATALVAPVSAQQERGYGFGYDSPAYEAPPHHHRAFHGSYNEAPAIGPLFHGGGWVPEPVYDHSRPGGIDPNLRPPS